MACFANRHRSITSALFLVLTALSCKASHKADATSKTLEASKSSYQDDRVNAFMQRDFTVDAKSKGINFSGKKINGSEMFNRGPLASVGLERMPFVVFRILPELAKEFDGEAVFGEPGHEFEKFGFFFDGRKPNWPAPLGFTWSAPGQGDASNIAYAERTCASCHVARITLDSKTHYLEGAPNIEMDFHAFSVVWVDFVEKALSPDNRNKTKALILKIIDEKPVDWFFNNQSSFNPTGDLIVFDAGKAQEQIKIVKENIDGIMADMADVNSFRKTINDGMNTVFQHAPRGKQPHDYGPPGILDSNNNGILTMVLANNNIINKNNPEKAFDVNRLFPASTKVSIPSVWQQGRRKGAQWTANVQEVFFRNTVAAIGFVDSAKDLNGIHLEVVSRYISELPSPKYPGEIAIHKAAAGKEVYESARCASCHIAEHKEFPKVFKMGTSRNRMMSSVPGLGAVVAPQLFSTCLKNENNKTLELTVDGRSNKPCQVDFKKVMAARDTEENTGYPAMPLDGVWARAPYFHNGAIPTLYHLLASNNGESLRPEKFLVGSTKYDFKKGGWLWNDADADSKATSKGIYDTELDGFSRRGHEGAGADGMWKDPKTGEQFKLSWNINDPSEKEALEDLIEYLKTIE